MIVRTVIEQGHGSNIVGMMASGAMLIENSCDILLNVGLTRGGPGVVFEHRSLCGLICRIRSCTVEPGDKLHRAVRIIDRVELRESDPCVSRIICSDTKQPASHSHSLVERILQLPILSRLITLDKPEFNLLARQPFVRRGEMEAIAVQPAAGTSIKVAGQLELCLFCAASNVDSEEADR